MLKNKKGFTVVEVGVSFCLMFGICILLFQVVLKLKEVYISSDVKTTLLNKQGVMLQKIYKDFDTKELRYINYCGLNCISFEFYDGTISNYSVDPITNSITYDDYTWWLDKASKIHTSITGYMYDIVPINVDTKIGDTNFFQIKTMINNELINNNKNYGINIIYKIPTGGIATNNNNDNTYYVAGVPCDYNNNWLTIFKHEKINNIVTPFTSEDEVKYSNENGKTSVLGSLESFRNPDTNNFKFKYCNSSNCTSETTQSFNFMTEHNPSNPESADYRWVNDAYSFITAEPDTPTVSMKIATKTNELVYIIESSDEINLKTDITYFTNKYPGGLMRIN